MALAGDIGVLNLGPLHLILPPTWKFDGSKNPIEGVGPEGEEVLISIARSKPAASVSASPTPQDLAISFSKDKMALLALKNGKTVLRPVTPMPTPEGKVAFSAASEKSGFFGGSLYFVQYLLASESALIYMTIEGKGKAAPVVERFDEIMNNQQWDE